MKYLAPFVIVLFAATANAEPDGTEQNRSDTVAGSQATIQATTQSVAQKLITILGLASISGSETSTVDLKTVVIKALGEGKSMPEIRQATNQAIKMVTGKTLSIEPTSSAQTSSAGAPAVSSDAQPQSTTVAASSTETTLDPETGKMMATVLPGESIFRMAQRVYGQENGRKYLEIYEANRDKIRDINVVVEGQVLVMP